MRNSIKAVCACAFFAAALAAAADTFVFYGRGSFGDMSGQNGNLSMDIYATETSSQIGPDKAVSPGALFSGTYYTATKCWYGYGETTSIQFKATGPLPNQLTASGSIAVTWVNYCGAPSSFTETITFSGDWSAITDQANLQYFATHSQYGNTVRLNVHNVSNSAPATVSGGTISSPAFGTVTPTDGSVGRNSQHDVQIVR